MVQRSVAALALGIATACGAPPLSCGDGVDPHVVTGLSGILDDGRPAIEIQLRVPMDCQVLDTIWMFWHEDTDEVTLDEAPTEGVLDREGIEAGEDIISFADQDLAVRLDYPDAIVGPEVTFTWLSSGSALAYVDCAAEGEALACGVRAP